MPLHRYIITFLLLSLLVSCSQYQEEQKVPDKSAAPEPVWHPPFPPGRIILHWEYPSELTKEDLKEQIKTREPVIPYWVTSRKAPSEITSGKIKAPKLLHRKKQYLMSISLPLTDPHSFLSIQFDNDVFLSMDYYYTNGIQFQYIHPALQRSRILSIAIPYRKKSLNYFGIRLVQNMYTPTRLDIEQVLVGDRPFASYLYLGFFKTTYDKENKLKLHSGLDIGLLGPTSLGGLIQTTIHSTEPTGWANQIGNDILLSYHASIEKGILEKELLTWNIAAGAIGGTLYDNAYISTLLMAGKQEPYFNGYGLQCGSNRQINKLQYVLIAGLKTTLVGYDATLQGGLFNKNEIYSLSGDEIERFTYSAIAGFQVKYKWFGLTGKIHYISSEFKGGRDHKWVSIGTTFCL